MQSHKSLAMRISARVVQAIALWACLGLGKVVHAGYTAWCKVDDTKRPPDDQWVGHDSTAFNEPWQQAPLSQAQLDALQMEADDPARLLIGGRGQGHIVGIPSTIDGAGCTENSYCMWMCQALCCLAKDCKMAVQQTREGSSCCDPTCLCTVEEKMRYCYLHATFATAVKSNNAATCVNDEKYTHPTMTGQCAQLVQSELGLTLEQADYIASLGYTKRALARKHDILADWVPPKAFLTARRQNQLEAKMKKVENKMEEKFLKAQKRAGGAKKWKAGIADNVCPSS